jgi:hypothetical protein
MRWVKKSDLLLRHRVMRQQQAQLSIPDGLHSQERRKVTNLTDQYALAQMKVVVRCQQNSLPKYRYQSDQNANR